MTQPLAIVGAVSLLFVLVLMAASAWARMRSRERIHCVQKQSDFDVDFVRRLSPVWGPSDKLDVARCTAFDDPEHVECEKQCVAESDQALVAKS